jgi:hypothetical protein
LLLRGLSPRLLTRNQIRDLVDHFGLDRAISADADGGCSTDRHAHNPGA